MSDFLEIVRGDSPLILSMPHGGRELAPDIAARLNERGLAMADTDWWIERLYNFHTALDANVVRTKISRYVIDVNRDPSGASLYPGQATTGLCPTQTFDGEPIYFDGEEPSETEIAERAEHFFAPYHDSLEDAIASTRERHGYALLYDCHSIRSVVPRLFDGELPVFNIGTNNGLSCAPELAQIVTEACAGADGLTHIVNGRFKGGWITRRYGDPANNVHAVQMEMAQWAYMEEAPPWTYNEERAATARDALKRALTGMIGWAADNLGGNQ